MATNRDRILDYLRKKPDGADDDELAVTLDIKPRQTVNTITRKLADEKLSTRIFDPARGKIVNRLVVLAERRATIRAVDPPLQANIPAPSIGTPTSIVLPDAESVLRFAYMGEAQITEDEVKGAISKILLNDGWQVDTAWGHTHGADIAAIRGAERLVIEAKGEGSLNAMRVNYFVSSLGELVQRMESPDAVYALGLPAHRQLARLVLRLPVWIRQHLKLRFYLVRRAQDGNHDVGLFEP